MTKKKMGRPPLDNALAVRLGMRCTAEEKRMWKIHAANDGVELTTWIRETCNRAARKSTVPPKKK